MSILQVTTSKTSAVSRNMSSDSFCIKQRDQEILDTNKPSTPSTSGVAPLSQVSPSMVSKAFINIQSRKKLIYDNPAAESPNNKDGLIKMLFSKINGLEKKIATLESDAELNKVVTAHLLTEIDKQNQYSRRPCFIITSIKPSAMTHNDNGDDESHDDEPDKENIINILAETGLKQDEIASDIEKLHPIAP